MNLSVHEIASLVGGHVGTGSRDLVICGAAGLKEAGPTDITFLRDAKNKSNIEILLKSSAGAYFVPETFSCEGKTLIQVKNPIMAFSKILEILASELSPKRTGIHPHASISPRAKIGRDVYIGPFCVIEDEVIIGDGVQMMGQVFVGQRSTIGAGTLLHPQVVIREDVKVGKNCLIHSGVVIGGDGYGFFWEGTHHHKIPQIGTVIVEDNVEIGANTTVDRATTGETRIGQGSKIDNLVQIAHNVIMGQHCLLVAQMGIGGSCRLGNGVVAAGQVGIGDHVQIGDGAQIGAQSGVKYDVPAGAVMFGTYAQPLQDALKQQALVRKLPELFKLVRKSKNLSTENL